MLKRINEVLLTNYPSLYLSKIHRLFVIWAIICLTMCLGFVYKPKGIYSNIFGTVVTLLFACVVYDLYCQTKIDKSKIRFWEFLSLLLLYFLIPCCFIYTLINVAYLVKPSNKIDLFCFSISSSSFFAFLHLNLCSKNSKFDDFIVAITLVCMAISLWLNIPVFFFYKITLYSLFVIALCFLIFAVYKKKHIYELPYYNIFFSLFFGIILFDYTSAITTLNDALLCVAKYIFFSFLLYGFQGSFDEWLRSLPSIKSKIEIKYFTFDNWYYKTISKYPFAYFFKYIFITTILYFIILNASKITNNSIIEKILLFYRGILFLVLPYYIFYRRRSLFSEISDFREILHFYYFIFLNLAFLVCTINFEVFESWHVVLVFVFTYVNYYSIFLISEILLKSLFTKTIIAISFVAPFLQFMTIEESENAAYWLLIYFTILTITSLSALILSLLYIKNRKLTIDAYVLLSLNIPVCLFVAALWYKDTFLRLDLSNINSSQGLIYLLFIPFIVYPILQIFLLIKIRAIKNV